MDGVYVWKCFGRSLEVWSQQMMNSAGGEEEEERAEEAAGEGEGDLQGEEEAGAEGGEEEVGEVAEDLSLRGGRQRCVFCDCIEILPF